MNDRLAIAAMICGGLMSGVSRWEDAVLPDALAEMSLQIADRLIIRDRWSRADFEARVAHARRGYPLWDPETVTP